MLAAQQAPATTVPSGAGSSQSMSPLALFRSNPLALEQRVHPVFGKVTFAALRDLVPTDKAKASWARLPLSSE